MTLITWSPRDHHHPPITCLIIRLMPSSWNPLLVAEIKIKVKYTHIKCIYVSINYRKWKTLYYIRKRTKHGACVSIPIPTTVGVEGDGNDLGVEDDDVIQLPHLVISPVSDVVLIYVMSDNHRTSRHTLHISIVLELN